MNLDRRTRSPSKFHDRAYLGVDEIQPPLPQRTDIHDHVQLLRTELEGLLGLDTLHQRHVRAMRKTDHGANLHA